MTLGFKFHAFFLTRYKIDFLSAESAFLFNMKFSACFESAGDCRLSFPIMTDVKVPFLPCDFKTLPFAIPGKIFSFFICQLYLMHVLKFF